MAGGRPKGSRNKTPAFQRKIGEGGVTPLEYLLEVVRDVAQDQNERIKAAVAAAPYIHPRLSQVEQTVTHVKSLKEHSEAELAEFLEEGSGAGAADEAKGEGESSRVH